MERLSQILQEMNLVSLVYYSCSSYCRFIKCIDNATGVLFLLRVSSSYRLAVPPEFSQVALQPTRDVLVADPERPYSLFVPEKNIEALYAPIQKISAAQHALQRRMYEQIQRMGKCLRYLEFRVVMESHGLVLEMDENWSLQWFQSADTGTAYRWYLVLPLETLYKRRGLISRQLATVEKELEHVLDTAYEHQSGTFTISALKACVASMEHYSVQKRRIRKQIKEVNTYLARLNSDYQSKVDQRESLHEHTETNRALVEQDLERQMKEIKQKLFKTTSLLSQKCDELKHCYLVLENAAYTLHKSLREVHEN